MKKLIFFFFALTLSVEMWAEGSVFTYTATEKLTDPFNAIGGITSHEFSNGEGKVTYVSTISTIAKSAFEGCKSLQSITLPASVTTIGESVFSNCPSLQSINLSNVTTIGNAAFQLCAALQSIDLSHVTTIGNYAFQYCKALQSIDLSHVTTIESGAFGYCSSLTDVTVAWTEATKIPTIDENVFRYIANSQGPSGATLHIPAGMRAIYQVAAVWNTFGTIDDPNPSLSDAKVLAINAIQAAANAAKTEIDAASAYKAADAIKLDYKAKINLVIEASTDSINNEASTEAMANEFRDKAMLQINGRKEEALTKIAKINEFEDAKVQAITDITNARQGIQNENLNNWIDGAINDIKNGGPDATPGIDEIKEEVLNLIHFFKEGKAEALGDMGTPPLTDCPAVKVTKGEKEVILYAPDAVEMIKVSANK